MLIVRLGAMGDILHSLPAVTALRAAHPEWFLGWAVEPQWRALLATEGASAASLGMPVVDRLHIVPAKQWARAPFSAATFRNVHRLRRELREGGYDVCLDLQGAVRSAVIAKWARAARLIGEDKPREWAARWFFTERIPTNGVHVIEQAMEVANAVAHDNLSPMMPWFPREESAERWCDGMLSGKDLVLLNPGAGWGAKRWPVERYAVVAKALANEGYGIVANAGPREELLAQTLAAESGGAAMAVKPSLGELIALTRRASLVIAGDTGPLHLANALGRPVVGIFGPTDPARNGPFSGNFRVLRHPESRRNHARKSEPEAGLLTITPGEVLAAAHELLKETR